MPYSLIFVPAPETELSGAAGEYIQLAPTVQKQLNVKLAFRYKEAEIPSYNGENEETLIKACNRLLKEANSETIIITSIQQPDS